MLDIISDQCVSVAFPGNTSIAKVLQSVREIVTKEPQYSVIVDLSKVTILSSRNLSELMMLRNTLDQNGQRLILCNVPFQIKCEFRVAGLHKVFEFSQDKYSAMNALQIKNLPE
ncbi:MAG: STAS domain-containing protein [Sedimentisphaerales bacterium]|nr:STAS domain-containing protein [Sedimentisphaerales bacterium]